MIRNKLENNERDTHNYKQVLEAINRSVNVTNWQIPVNPGGNLEIFIQMCVKEEFKGLKDNEALRLEFYDFLLKDSFFKVFYSDPCAGWSEEIHGFIYSISLTFVELAAVTIDRDCIGILKTLHFIFDENSIFHTVNKKRQNDPTHLKFILSRNKSDFNPVSLNRSSNPSECVKEFSESENLVKFLVDFIQLFEEFNGLATAKERFNQHLKGTRVMEFELLSSFACPFLSSVNHYKQETIDDFIRPLYMNIMEHVKGLTNKLESENTSLLLQEMKRIKDSEIFQSLFKSLSHCSSSLKVEAPVMNDFINFKLYSLFLSIQTGSFNVRMNNLDNLTKIMSSVSNPHITSRSATHDLDHGFTTENISFWISKHIGSLLSENMHNLQYMEKIKKLLVFLQKYKKLTTTHIDVIWSLRTGKHEAIVKNIHELIVYLAKSLEKEQFDHIFLAIQNEWKLVNSKEKEHLINLLKRLVLEGSSPQISESVLKFLWEFAISSDTNEDIASVALDAHFSILDADFDKISENKKKWIQYFIEIIKGKHMQVQNKPATYIVLYAVDMFHRLIIVQYDSTASDLLEWIQKEYQLVDLMTDSLENFLLTTCIKDSKRSIHESHSSSASSTMTRDKDMSLFKTSTVSLTPSEYTLQIETRLKFIKDLVTMKNFEISLLILQRIWKCLMDFDSFDNNTLFCANSPGDNERMRIIRLEVCSNWFQSNLYSKLDLDTTINFYNSTLLSMPINKYSSSEFKLFKYFFEHINSLKGCLVIQKISSYNMYQANKDARSLIYTVKDINLLGIDHLWQLAFKCDDETVSEMAISLLLYLHTSLHDDFQVGQKEINGNFVKKCIRSMEESINIIDKLETGLSEPCGDMPEDQASLSNLSCHMNMLRRSLLILNSFIIQAEIKYDNSLDKLQDTLPLHQMWRGSKICLKISCASEYESINDVVQSPFFEISTSTNHSFVDLHNELLIQCIESLGIFSLDDEIEKAFENFSLKISFVDSNSQVHAISEDLLILPLFHFITERGFYLSDEKVFIFKIYLEVVGRKHKIKSLHYEKNDLSTCEVIDRCPDKTGMTVNNWISNNNKTIHDQIPNSSSHSSVNQFVDNSQTSSLNNEIEDAPNISDLDEPDTSMPLHLSWLNNRSSNKKHLPGYQLAECDEENVIIFRASLISAKLAGILKSSSQYDQLMVLHQVEDLLMALLQWIPHIKSRHNSLSLAIKNSSVIQYLDQVFQRSTSEFLYQLQILYSIIMPKALTSDCQASLGDYRSTILSLLDQGVIMNLLNHPVFQPSHDCIIIHITKRQIIISWILHIVNALYSFLPLILTEKIALEGALSAPKLYYEDLKNHLNSEKKAHVTQQQWLPKKLDDIKHFIDFCLAEIRPLEVTADKFSRKYLVENYGESFKKKFENDEFNKFYNLTIHSPQYGYNISSVMPEKCCLNFDFDNYIFSGDSEVISHVVDPVWEKAGEEEREKLDVLLSLHTAHLPSPPRMVALAVLPLILSPLLMQMIEDNSLEKTLLSMLDKVYSVPYRLVRSRIERTFHELLSQLVKSNSPKAQTIIDSIFLNQLSRLKETIYSTDGENKHEYFKCIIEIFTLISNPTSRKNQQVSSSLQNLLPDICTGISTTIEGEKVDDWDTCHLINLFKVASCVLKKLQTVDMPLTNFLKRIMVRVLFSSSYLYSEFTADSANLVYSRMGLNEPVSELKSAAFRFTIEASSKSNNDYTMVSQVLKELVFDDLSTLYLDWLQDFEDGKNRFVGLRNAGATCYMNSILQQIYSIEALRNAIIEAKPMSLLRKVNQSISYESEDEECDNVKNSLRDSTVIKEPIELSEDKIQNLKVLSQLQRLFVHLNYSQLPYYNPQGFLEDFKLWGERVNKHEQHDALEFFSCLVDNVDEAMKLCNKQKPIESLFTGTTENQMICLDCPHRTQREETFITIIADVLNLTTLKESLEQYVKEDLLEGGNAYKCETCQKKVRAIKRAVIKKCPPILACQLSRFRFDYELGIPMKSNGYFEFPRKINLFPYTVQGINSNDEQKVADENNVILTDQNHILNVDEDSSGFSEGRSLSQMTSSSNQTAINPQSRTDSRNSISNPSIDPNSANTNYTLRGIVVHSGQASGGHYYSYIRVPSVANKSKNNNSFSYSWYKFDDKEVREIDLENDELLRSECFGGEVEDKSKFSYLKQNDKNPTHHDKHWNAYLLFYERDDLFNPMSPITDLKSITENTRNLKVHNPESSSTSSINSLTDPQNDHSLDVVNSVVRRNLKYSHTKSLISPSFIEFMYDFLHLSTSKINSLDVNEREHIADALMAEFLPFYLRVVLKIDHNSNGKWLSLFQELISRGSKPCTRFITHGFFLTPSIVHDYLFDCPHIDVRLMFSSLISSLCHHVSTHKTKLSTDIYEIVQNYKRNFYNHSTDSTILVNNSKLVKALNQEDRLAIQNDEPVYILDIVIHCLLHQLNYTNSKCLHRLKSSTLNNVSNYYNNSSSEFTNLFRYGIINMFDTIQQSVTHVTALQNENFDYILSVMNNYYQPGCFAQYLGLLCDIAGMNREMTKILTEKYNIVQLLIQFLIDDESILSMSISNLSIMSGRLNHLPTLYSSIEDKRSSDSFTRLLLNHVNKLFSTNAASEDHVSILHSSLNIQRATLVTIVAGAFGIEPNPITEGLYSGMQIYSPKEAKQTQAPLAACTLTHCVKFNFFMLLSHTIRSLDLSRYCTSSSTDVPLNPYRTFVDDSRDPYVSEISEELAELVYDTNDKIIPLLIKDNFEGQYFCHIADIILFLSYENYELSQQAIQICSLSITDSMYIYSTECLRSLLQDILTIDDSLVKNRFDYFLVTMLPFHKTINSLNGYERQISIYFKFFNNIFARKPYLAEILSKKEKLCSEFSNLIERVFDACRQVLESNEEHAAERSSINQLRDLHSNCESLLRIFKSFNHKQEANNSL